LWVSNETRARSAQERPCFGGDALQLGGPGSVVNKQRVALSEGGSDVDVAGAPWKALAAQELECRVEQRLKVIGSHVREVLNLVGAGDIRSTNSLRE